MEQEPTYGEQTIYGTEYMTMTYPNGKTIYWFPTFFGQGMWVDYNGLMNLLEEWEA